MGRTYRPFTGKGLTAINPFKNGENYFQRMLKQFFISMPILPLLALAGCNTIDFEPFDYEHWEDAKLSMKQYGCSVSVHDSGRRIYLRKKLKPRGVKHYD